MPETKVISEHAAGQLYQELPEAMAPYYGAEEVRCMEDPLFQGKDWISQRPRIMTAPLVQRPGPFDPFFTDSAYDAPEPAKYNALPVGVSR